MMSYKTCYLQQIQKNRTTNKASFPATTGNLIIKERFHNQGIPAFARMTITVLLCFHNGIYKKLRLWSDSIAIKQRSCPFTDSFPLNINQKSLVRFYEFNRFVFFTACYMNQVSAIAKLANRQLYLRAVHTAALP